MRFWQIAESDGLVKNVYEYWQDPCAGFVYHYAGCQYKFRGLPVSSLLVKAAVMGLNVRFFKTKPNVAKGVVLEKDMEMLGE